MRDDPGIRTPLLGSGNDTPWKPLSNNGGGATVNGPSLPWSSSSLICRPQTVRGKSTKHT